MDKIRLDDVVFLTPFFSSISISNVMRDVKQGP